MLRHILALAALAAAAGCTNDIGITCPPGQTLCGEFCVYTQSDPKNCGACDNACAATLACVAGVCGCPSGLTKCGDSCVDTASSVANCGGCGMACPTGQVCSLGACAGSCAAGLTDCSGSCCSASQTCTSGTCTTNCPAGTAMCSNGCKDLIHDTTNCGTCGNACPADHFCVMGLCILGCPQPLLRCLPGTGKSDGGTQCVDPIHDPVNCGGCSDDDKIASPPSPTPAPYRPHVCPTNPGEHENAVCDNGSCGFVCQASYVDCTPRLNQERSHGSQSFDPAVGGPFCVDPDFDNCNCGICGEGPSSCWGYTFDVDDKAVCRWFCGGSVAEICCNGAPTTSGAKAACGSTCGNIVDCGSNNCCAVRDTRGLANGNACSNPNTDVLNCGSCDNDCNDMFGGPDNSPACCSGSCVDVAHDVNNCGTCANSCFDVVFPSPSPNATCCPDGCKDANNDVANCGSCGRDCRVFCGNPGAFCQFGNCMPCEG